MPFIKKPKAVTYSSIHTGNILHTTASTSVGLHGADTSFGLQSTETKKVVALIKPELIGKIKVNFSLDYDENKCQVVSMPNKNKLELVVKSKNDIKDDKVEDDPPAGKITTSGSAELKTSLIEKKEYFIYKMDPISGNHGACRSLLKETEI